MSVEVNAVAPRSRVMSSQRSSSDSVAVALGLEGGSCTSAVLGCTPAAVRNSLDSQPWVRVAGGELRLSGLAPGRHVLQLRAENLVENFDNTSRQLSFVAGPAGVGGGEASSLSVVEGPLNVTSLLTAGLTLAGSALSGAVLWRVDGGAWKVEFNVSSPVTLRDPAADAMHYFEAPPVDDM